jgi:ABC-type Fe3+/spermidine/putrescine transport system ATPase subunit
MTDYDVVIEHVDKTYPGGVRAVIDFNARIEKGAYVALLGPSGCGKTTMLRMIGGLEEATAGRIFIADENVTDLPPSQRDTSMMFQSFALFPHRTVLQNVEFSLKMQGMESNMRTHKAMEMIDLVDLTPLAQRRPQELSGGQQQRVALARALISQPTLLLLDEPLGALDYSLRETMMIELKKIQRDLGITFIMVTHSQQEALAMADMVIVMSDSIVQQIGSAREIHENPRTKFVAEFIGDNNLFTGRVQSQSGSVVFVESDCGLIYARAPDHSRRVAIGSQVHISVRADLMHTGAQPNMANHITGTFAATKFLGTLETNIFEILPGKLIHVEQHRKLSGERYSMGDQETIAWSAEASIILDQPG